MFMEDKYWNLNEGQRNIYDRLVWSGDGAINSFTLMFRANEIAQKGLWNVSGTVRTEQSPDDISNALWAAMCDRGYLSEEGEDS